MEILYQDDRVIVCVKPAGVLSTDEPGGMPDLLRAALGQDGAVIKSVHRLDRAVGGVMVYARTRRAASDIAGEIAAGGFQKEYLAVTEAAPPAEQGTWEDWLLRDKTRRVTEIVPAGMPGALRASLDYRLVGEAGGMALLSIRLHTGRTHQIRCQAAAHAAPLVGDEKYGGRPGAGIALWSRRVAFTHPRTGVRMDFSCPPPRAHPWILFDIGK